MQQQFQLKSHQNVHYQAEAQAKAAVIKVVHHVVVIKGNLVAVDTVAIVLVENQANVVVDQVLLQDQDQVQVIVQIRNAAAATVVVASQLLTDVKAAETVTLLSVTKTKKINFKKVILLMRMTFFVLIKLLSEINV